MGYTWVVWKVSDGKWIDIRTSSIYKIIFGFIVLGVYSAIRTPHILKINKRGIIYSVIIGIICQAMFNLCYFKAIDTVGVSVAAVLLYTSPLFLAVFSKFFYKESITRSKIFSLIFALLELLWQ